MLEFDKQNTVIKLITLINNFLQLIVVSYPSCIYLCVSV